MLTNPTCMKLSIFFSLVAIKMSRVPTYTFYRRFINPPAARFPISKVPGEVIEASSHVFKRKLDGTLREGGGWGAAGTRAPLPRTGIGFSWKSLEFPNRLWLCAVSVFFIYNCKGDFFLLALNLKK